MAALQKRFDCLGCGESVLLEKLPPGQMKKWIKYELDGVPEHMCRNQQPEQSAATEEPEKQQPAVSNDLSKEIAAIKAQLLVLASTLDGIEAELKTHVS